MVIKPFEEAEFLKHFELSRDHINFSDSVFFALDQSIREHISFGNKNLEDYLIAQAEFLSTFSTAKAEEINALSAKEARQIIGSFLGFGEGDVAIHAAQSGKEFDELEFKNIVRGFRMACEKGLPVEDLSVDALKELHLILTMGLDQLGRYVRGNEPEFCSGSLRQADVSIGGLYSPAPFLDIQKELETALRYFKANPSIADCFIFSLAVYAVHPFGNGNKRVCRIMEHALLRSLGINRANMYSHIVEAYHNLQRYKEAIQASLSRKILNNLVNMQLESLFWAQMQTLQAAVEFDRKELVSEFLKSHSRKYLPQLLQSLISRKAIRYTEIKNLLAKISDKVLTTLLNWCLEYKVLQRRVKGKESHYSLSLDSQIELDLARFYTENKKRITYTPEEFRDSILLNSELFRGRRTKTI